MKTTFKQSYVSLMLLSKESLLSLKINSLIELMIDLTNISFELMFINTFIQNCKIVLKCDKICFLKSSY